MNETNQPPRGRDFHVSKRYGTRTAVVFLLAIQATLLAWQAWRYSPTIDEPAHLVAGLSHWEFGTFDLYRVNPPLVRLVASLPMLLVAPKIDWSGFTGDPVARPEFGIGAAFLKLNAPNVFWYFTLCRWSCIPLILIGGYHCYCWAHDLYGASAGMVALILWCFCPNILGNGALITPDAAAAALGITASYRFWWWLSISARSRRLRWHLRKSYLVVPDSPHCAPRQDSGWARALLAGLTLGLAELTKSTWVVLFALWPLLWLVWRVASSPSPFSIFHLLPVSWEPACIKSPARTNRKFEPPGPRLIQLVAILVLALYILNLGYFFQNSFQRLDKFQFTSRALGGPNAHETPGNRFDKSWMGMVPLPLPANYLRGLDVQRREFEIGKWSYLRGEKKKGAGGTTTCTL